MRFFFGVLFFERKIKKYYSQNYSLTSFADKTEEVELKEDDYGPNYADNKSWFVVKKVNFRIGDMVSIIEKVLSEEQEASGKASETTVGGKRRRRQTTGMQLDARSRKNEQAGMLESEVDNEDDSDDELVFKKKIQVSTKTYKNPEGNRRYMFGKECRI